MVSNDDFSSYKKVKPVTPIEIFIGELDRPLFISLRSALITRGFNGVEWFNNVDMLREQIVISIPDLILIDNEMNDTNAVVNLIKDIRACKVGINPFVPIIATIWRPSYASMSAMINAGVDGILAKPISINTLYEQVDSLTESRSPFVVTTQYIGPDRRSDNDHASFIPMINPPNTLFNKVYHIDDKPEKIKQLIQKATERLHDLRVKRNGIHFCFLAGLLKAFAERGATKQSIDIIKTYYTVTRDLKQRISEEKFKEIKDLLEEFVELLNDIYKSHDKIPETLLESLNKKSYVFATLLNDDRTETSIQQEVQQSIENYFKRIRQKETDDSLSNNRVSDNPDAPKTEKTNDQMDYKKDLNI